VVEGLAALVPLVDELDADAGVQERELAQALLQDLVLELDVGEDLVAGLEPDRRAALVAGADHGQGRHRVAEPVLLGVLLAVAVDGQVQRLGERVDDGHADAVQAARDLVRRVVEFPAGV
jgi:hypothetical protein